MNADQLANPTALLAEMTRLRDDVLREADEIMDRWEACLPEKRAEFCASTHNLAHYLALRHHDLRDLQAALRPWGLSSLGRIEAQVMQNLEAVIATLARLSGQTGDYPSHPLPDAFAEGGRRLEAETRTIFGPAPKGRRVRMMVTLPSAAADDPDLAREMLLNGMNVARINCAHDTHADWARMIAHLRAAERVCGRACRVAMDLGGPKSRTADVMKPDKYRAQKGDTILLRADAPQPLVAYPVQVRCTLMEALEQVQVGEAVWFDDGKIGAVVRQRLPEGVVLEVTSASIDGDKLKDDKGINFPDTALELDPLTTKDLADLDFVVAHADMINFSFVQRPADVQRLHNEIIARNPASQIALVLKIETRRAIDHLPDLIVTAGSRHPVGVMIARGDLAVEIGFERMAEMQEEILWVCEAAHVPVVWATQVLESLAKQGRPSRAEMTDAAMSERAECVMLNKGPYILQAMGILDGVLARMQAHQIKKVTQLRALRSW